jgi:hypothetical protein
MLSLSAAPSTLPTSHILLPAPTELQALCICALSKRGGCLVPVLTILEIPIVSTIVSELIKPASDHVLAQPASLLLLPVPTDLEIAIEKRYPPL